MTFMKRDSQINLTNPTQLDPYLNPGTQPKLGFIKYIIGLNQSDPIWPEFWTWVSNPTWPEIRVNPAGLTLKIGTGLAALPLTFLDSNDFQ